jgi:hypothetical protein
LKGLLLVLVVVCGSIMSDTDLAMARLQALEDQHPWMTKVSALLGRRKAQSEVDAIKVGGGDDDEDDDADDDEWGCGLRCVAERRCA